MVTRDPETVEPRLSRLEGAYEHVATKEDVANVRTEVANVRTEIADLRTYIAAMESRLIRWAVGGMGVGFAIMTAVVKLT